MPKVDTKTYITKEKLLQALIKTLGVVSVAVKQVEPDATRAETLRVLHYDWLKNDPVYAEKVNSIDDIALDFAESQLHKQIQSGEVSSTIFYLKTKGKKRGYIERNDVNMTSDRAIEFKIE